MLKPLCEPDRFIFAGSLRRLKSEVGDIEIVYVPRIEQQPDPADLFGKTLPINLVDRMLDQLLKAGLYTKREGPNGGSAWGPSNKLAVHAGSGIGVDFFQADNLNFYSLLVCRTGSMESNTRI